MQQANPIDPHEVIREQESKWAVERVEDYDRFIEQLIELGGTFAEPRLHEITDHYLDSDEHYFVRGRCRCRLRNQDGRWQLTFKESSPPSAELFSRREKSFTLPGTGGVGEALAYCAREIFPGIAAGLRVTELFSLHNRRESRDLRFPDGLALEASFDRYEMRAGTQRFTGMEIELELKGGSADALAALVTKLIARTSLAPHATSKYDRAAQQLGIEVPPLVEPQYLFGYSSSLAEAAQQIVRTELAKIRQSEPAVRVGVYSDAIHDMRVACRKIRAAARSFESSYSPEAAALFDDVVWLGRALGVGRDLEVHTACIREVVQSLDGEDQERLEGFCTDLEARFEMERARILEILDSARYANLITGLTKLSGRRAGAGGGQRSASAGREIIAERLRGILARYPNGAVPAAVSDDELHRLRIRLKRVRYLAEFFLHISPPEIAHLLANTKAVQKLLGEHQDYRVGRELVAERLAAEEDGNKVAALRRLQGQVEALKLYYRNAFIQAWPEYCSDPSAPKEETQ